MKLSGLLNPLLIALVAVCALPAQAAPTWFTVVGDIGDAATDTVQVDPTPQSISGETRSMAIRVNRQSPRANWDGVPYRSYLASVEFNCARLDAHFQTVTYFMKPMWTGDSHQAATFTPQNARPMRFRDMTPNPMERIIKAACAGYKPR